MGGHDHGYRAGADFLELLIEGRATVVGDPDLETHLAVCSRSGCWHDNCSKFATILEQATKAIPVMNWSIVPILIAIVVGLVGFCLIVAAFLLVAHQGGWRQAMRSAVDGRWSVPRRLMFVGALLGLVYCAVVMVLFVVPGGIPWLDGSGWSYVVAVLPPLAAVWYFVIRPAVASRRNQTAGCRSQPSNGRCDA
jgi:hypothetical protein